MRKSISLASRVGIAASLVFNSPENARPWPGPLGPGLSGLTTVVISMCTIFKKCGVPRPVTYATQSQPTTKINESKSRGRTNRIPSGDGGESIGAAAAQARARCDVGEALESLAVQPGIEEAKRFLPHRKQEVIKQRDYPCHGLYTGIQLDARG
jgi:hypothetical protein